ncbi:MAG: SAM-dependent methyltransferase, partial [Pseudomonadota bacterium]|nr:SAM-dependent methyltransferase [Pseudomonadota bacterium]
MSKRGAHLVHGDRGFSTGGGLLARLVAPTFASVVERIDRRLERGGLDVRLPDGSRRRLGFRAPG